jgi:hypothetical protein
VSGLVKDTFARRLRGDRPSPLRAGLAAAAAGVAVAALTYRAVRS